MPDAVSRTDNRSVQLLQYQKESQMPGDDNQAVLEVGNTETKKQNEHLKRFGNKELKNNPLLGSVREAVKTLPPEQVVKMLVETKQNISGQSARVNLDKQEMPQLKTPFYSQSEMAKGGSDAEFSSSARATALLGKMVQLATEMSVSNLVTQLQSLNAEFAGGAKGYSELATQLEQQGVQWASDVDALTASRQQANTLSHEVSKAEAGLSQAQSKLSSLEAEAVEQEPLSEALARDIDAAKQEVATAQRNLATSSATYNEFTHKVLNPAIGAEKNSRSALEATQSASQKVIDSFNPQQQNSIEAQRKQSDADSKTLTFLMALMSQLINKSTNEDLQATAELKQKLAEAAVKDAEKKAKEYEEQVRKAEEMQKTMGCIGKVLGWVITAVSVAAAAFTGGASLALAGVGLALALGDEIYQAVTGRSFMAEAMQPLMDAVIKPLMDLLGPVITSLLQSLGVDKESAEMAGQIIAAIMAAALLVAGVMVAGSVMSKVAGKVMQKLGGNVAQEASKSLGKNVAKEVAEEVGQEVAKKTTKTMVQRFMDSTVAQLFKRASKGLGRSFGADDLQVAKVANYSQQGMLVMTMANTSSQAAVGIVAATMLVEAAKARADLMNSAALQDLLNEMMSRAIDSFTHRMESVNEILKNISTVAENQMHASQYIARQLRGVAG